MIRDLIGVSHGSEESWLKSFEDINSSGYLRQEAAHTIPAFAGAQPFKFSHLS